ncbi:unnamed protein product [Nezara viridula]|uniref:Uncharacterized protein n=1 Tax=Nezara viridula TaxID=85310 RepID=A0A9P0HAG5_NEZVI|nr:unnamed protein product [Nezara viridula]
MTLRRQLIWIIIPLNGGPPAHNGRPIVAPQWEALQYIFHRAAPFHRQGLSQIARLFFLFLPGAVSSQSQS